MDSTVKFLLSVNPELAEKIMRSGKAEIVSRFADAKFDAFTKCPVSVYNPASEGSVQDLITSARQALANNAKAMGGFQQTLNTAKNELANATNQVTHLSLATRKALSNFPALNKRLGSISSLSFANMGIGLLNLGVEITGLVYIGKRLNDMRGKIDQVARSVSSVKSILTNEKITEYEKLSMQYASLMRKIRKKDASITWKDLEALLIGFKPFMSEMIRNLYQNNIDMDILLEIIYNLLPAYTGLLCLYIRAYYFEEKELPENTDVFMSLFSDLLNDSLRKKICEHLFLNKQVSVEELYKISQTQDLLALNSRMQIEDQIEILIMAETEDNYQSLSRAIDDSVAARIDSVMSGIADEIGLSENECLQRIQAAYGSYSESIS